MNKRNFEKYFYQKRMITTVFIIALFYLSLNAQFFQSGYSGVTITNTGSNFDDISGGGWNTTLENQPTIGAFEFQYDQEESGEMQALITNFNNDDVLEFVIRTPNIDPDLEIGRVQARVKPLGSSNPSAPLTHLYYSTRLFIPTTFDWMLNDTEFENSFLTLMEFWNNPNFEDEPYPFRVTVQLRKYSDENALRFAAKADTRGYEWDEVDEEWNGRWINEIWEYESGTAIIPFDENNTYPFQTGKWMTLDIYFIEGACDGRFVLKLTSLSGMNSVTEDALDITDYTHHPLDGSPDGLRDFNPLKLYTSDDIVNRFNAENGGTGSCYVYWDDFQIWDDPSDEVFDNIDPAQPCNIFSGPYLQNVTENCIVVKWRQTDNTSSTLTFTPQGGGPSPPIQVDGQSNNFEVKIENLTPGQTYTYEVSTNVGQTEGGTFTLPSSDGTITNFVVFGDAGKASDEQRLVLNQNLPQNAQTDLMILLGNNAWADTDPTMVDDPPGGATQNFFLGQYGLDYQYHLAVLDVYRDQIRNSVMYPVRGEFDINAADPDVYYDIFNLPATESGSNTEDYYSFNYNNIHFIALNSLESALGGGMRTWLEDDLAPLLDTDPDTRLDQDWVVVFFHHPPYYGDEPPNDPISPNIRTQILPVLEQAGVDLVLSAHSHNYQRSGLIFSGTEEFDPDLHILDGGNGGTEGAYCKNIVDEGTVYVVTGSAAVVDPINNTHPAMIRNISTLGSVSIQVDDLMMSVTFIDDVGVPADQFSIIKHDPPVELSIIQPLNEWFYTGFPTGGIPITVQVEGLTPQMVEVMITDLTGSVVDPWVLQASQDNPTQYTALWNDPPPPPGNGHYEIRAVIVDGGNDISCPDEVIIRIGGQTECFAINQSSDDAEEMDLIVGDGETVDIGSNDLELNSEEVGENNGVPIYEKQIVGLRFASIDLPDDAIISSTGHRVEFVGRAGDHDPWDINIFGENDENPMTFAEVDGDISGRTKTTAFVNVMTTVMPPNPMVWTEGTTYSFDIDPIINELNTVNSGLTDPVALIIERNIIPGRRNAHSYDNTQGQNGSRDETLVPRICLSYELPDPELPSEGAHFTWEQMEECSTEVIFTSASQDENVFHTWSVNGVFFSNEINPTIDLETYAIHSVTHTISVGELSATFMVDIAPVCADFELAFNNCSLTVSTNSLHDFSGLQHNWTIDGTPITPNPDFTLTEYGTYEVEHTVTFNEGSSTSSQQFTVLCADFEATPNGCDQPPTITLLGEPHSNEVNHSWSEDGTVFSTDANPTFNPGAEGVYEITHTVSVEGEPPHTETQIIPLLCAEFTFTTSDCSTEVTFTSQSTLPGITHQWFVNGVLESTAANPVLNLEDFGQSIVEHIVTFDNFEISFEQDINLVNLAEHHNFIVDVDMTWPNLLVESQDVFSGTVTIESGNTLTVESGTYHFCGTDTRIVVEPGATLILNGTLTDFNDNGWKGIELWGTNTAGAQYDSQVGQFQGEEFGVIENAFTAIQAWGPTINQTGGKVRCQETTFRNNRMGVTFGPYHRFYAISWSGGQFVFVLNYDSFFRGCTFENTPEYNSEAPLPNVKVRSFIDMRGIRGLQILGTTFTNSNILAVGHPIHRMIGISAADANFIVDNWDNGGLIPCQFNNLGYGVSSFRTTTNQPFTVRNSLFEDCLVGIRNRAVNGAVIDDNIFRIGNPPNIDQQTFPVNQKRQVGICFEDMILGFTCTNNEFTNTNPNGMTEFLMVGIFNDATGSSDKVIERNDFENLNIGVWADGENGTVNPFTTGLKYICNDFSGTLDNGNDIEVAEDATIRPVQSRGSASGDVGNTFDTSPNLGVTNIFNDGDDQITYHHSGTTPSFFGPFVPVAGNQILCSTPVLVFDKLLPPQQLDSLKSDFYFHKTAYYNASQQQSQTATEHRSKMDQNAFRITEHYMTDTLEESSDSILVWIDNFERKEAEMWLANEYLESGNTSVALQILNNLPVDYSLSSEEQQDIQNYTTIVNILDGKTIKNLDTTTVQLLLTHAEIGGHTQRWVENILTLYGEAYPPDYPTPGSQSGAGEKSESDEQKTRSTIEVYPNPAKDFVIFKVLVSEVEDVQLTIRDVNGRTILSENIEFPIKRWNTKSVPSGIYFYELWTPNGLLQSRKLSGGKIVIYK